MKIRGLVLLDQNVIDAIPGQKIARALGTGINRHDVLLTLAVVDAVAPQPAPVTHQDSASAQTGDRIVMFVRSQEEGVFAGVAPDKVSQLQIFRENISQLKCSSR